MGDPQSSFGREVLRAAWINSRTLLTSRLWAATLAAVSLCTGAAVQWLVAGFSMGLLSGGRAILYSVATGLVLFGLRFFWQLFLAPGELLHEEIQPVLQLGIAFGVPHAPNYSLWKRRKTYSVNELSALLAKNDPSAGVTIDFRTTSQLVLEALRMGELSGTDSVGNVRPPGQLHDIGTLIAKEDALRWAESRGFGDVVAPLR